MKTIRIVVFKFDIPYNDDPQLHIAEPLIEWENSEAGSWIMQNAIETPAWHMTPTIDFFGYEVVIIAEIEQQNYTYWKLKYG